MTPENHEGRIRKLEKVVQGIMEQVYPLKTFPPTDRCPYMEGKQCISYCKWKEDKKIMPKDLSEPSSYEQYLQYRRAIDRIRELKEALEKIINQHPEGYECRITEIARQALDKR